MSSTAAFASPSDLGADAAGLRPLSEMADSRAGGVPQARVRQILADLVLALSALHAQGRVHGGIAMDTVVRGEADPVRLLDPSGEQAPNGEDTLRRPGFAAFEQYTDDPASPCGPWTDVYGLSALAYALITGGAPPDALSRRVRDAYVPLAQLAPRGYDPAFLAGLDASLSMVAALRPQSLEAYDDLLMLPVPTPVTVAVVGAADEAAVGVAGVDPAAVAAAAPAVAVGTASADAAAQVDALVAPGAGSMAPSAPALVPASAPTSASTSASTSAAPSVAASAAAKAASVPPVGARDKSRRASGMGIALVVAILAVAGFFWLKGDEPATKVASHGPTPGSATPAQDQASQSSTQQNSAGQPPAGQAAPASTPAGPLAQATNPAGQAEPAPATQDPANSAATAPSMASASISPTNAPNASNAPANVAPNVATGSSADLPAAPSSPQPVVATATLDGAKPIPDRRTAPGAATVHDPQTTPAPMAAATPASSTPAASAAPASAPKSPVTVNVNVRPWGEVIVDGKSRGISPPLRELKLPPGKHSVVVQNAGLPPYRITLDLTEGRGASISHVFQ